MANNGKAYDGSSAKVRTEGIMPPSHVVTDVEIVSRVP